MKQVKVSYFCDFCKQPIDTDSDAVCVLWPGKVGYKDQFIPDDEEKAQHYHDYCMKNLLCLTYKNAPTVQKTEEAEEEPEELEQDDEPDHSQEDTEMEEKPKKKRPKLEVYLNGVGPEKVKKPKKDLPKLNALLMAGWKKKDCAVEFGVVPQTIWSWERAIEEMKESGEWEAYCEERRKK